MKATRILALVASLFVAVPAIALQPPAHRDLHDFEYRHTELWWSSVYRSLDQLPMEWSRSARADLDILGVHHERAFLDPRTGRWGTLIITRPMIPGTGVGNDLRWSDFDVPAPRDHYQLMDAASTAFLNFLAEHENELGFATDEMNAPRMQVHGDERIQVYIGRSVDGVPVRDSYITANINSGNLILMGQRNWGDMRVDTRPSLSETDAESALLSHLHGLQPDRYRAAPKLKLIPVSDEPDHKRVGELGEGLSYRLVWVLTPLFRDDIGTWEALIDAHDGELLAFEDTNHYHSDEPAHAGHGATHGIGDGAPSRGVIGGVFPVSNDGQAPDGVELGQQPMPFADVSLDGSPIGFTSTGGNAPTSGSGTLTTSLSGQFATINDNCGTLDESTSSGDLDMGQDAGTDCAVPPGSSSGNTSSSRTTYYGLNRIIEQAQGYLPANNWLGNQLTSNMNLNQSCNAFWNGTVNFYTSGSGCANTGEVMAVVHHEWGHGMDANSVNPGISRPGEGIADIYAQNMLNDSCVGRNFRPGVTCDGFGDACLECTGVRESDWALQQSGNPHDVAWVQSACTGTGNTPCGTSTHCEGSIVAEALWDLVHRDLQGFEGSPFDYDLNTALELGTRLTYEGAGAVGDWYQCTTNNGGCNADSGYLQYLAADADNGSLEDGTPHMSAIFAAFDRHQLACDTPTVQDAGCESAPTEAAQNLTVANFNEGVQLDWDPVDDAAEYWVYRTEGPMGCEFGKARVGQVSDTSFTETGLRNDFDVYYSVIAVDESCSCSGPMTPCVTATPEQGPSGTIEGSVQRGGTGEALAGVLIEAVGDEFDFSTETDESGQYSLTVLEGEYEVVASRAGFESASAGDLIIEEDDVITLDLVLDAPQVAATPSQLELIVPGGGDGQSALMIENTGTLDLEWSLVTDEAVVALESRDSHDPNLDEELALADFNLPGSGNHSEVLGGGIETRGQVVGFTFEGSVSGISGTQTWASDMALTVTGPDGEDFAVGGYQTSNPPWDFDGSGSSGDGTYDSTHIGEDIFGADGALDEGDWLFEFEHTWNDAMDWSDVTVTLHKVAAPVCEDPEDVDWLSTDPDSGTVGPGEGASVTVLVDASGLDEGLYEASLCLLSNAPENELVIVPVSVEVSSGPVLDVAPTELDFGKLEPGDQNSQNFTVSNAGESGAGSLELSALDLSGVAEFEITGGDCVMGAQLDSGDACQVEVTFAPSEADSFSGSIVVATTDGQSEAVTLSGQGMPDPGVLGVDPSSLAFGDVAVTRDASLTFTISNISDAGAMSLELAALDLSGDADFEITGGGCAVGAELDPADSCQVEVTFTPGSEESFSAEVLVTTADDQSQTVELEGEGFELPDDILFDRFEILGE